MPVILIIRIHNKKGAKNAQNNGKPKTRCKNIQKNSNACKINKCDKWITERWAQLEPRIETLRDYLKINNELINQHKQKQKEFEQKIWSFHNGTQRKIESKKKPKNNKIR